MKPLKSIGCAAAAFVVLAGASSAHAAWTFGGTNGGTADSTVAADSTGVSITGVAGYYAGNGGTLPSGAAGTSIVAAGTACAATQCGSAANNANTYGISGFAAAGTQWASSALQIYSSSNPTAGGLGMASDSTLGTAPNHAIDNGPATNSSDKISGIGNTESVLLSFSSSVVLSSIGLGYKTGDADISLFRYLGSSAPTLSGTGANLANMQAAGWQLVGNYGDLVYDVSNPYNTVNASNKGSSWWLISAYNTSYGAAASGTVDQGNDFFKIYAVAGSKCTSDCGPTTPTGNGVPEPSSWALVAIAGIGAVGARRRKQLRVGAS